MTSDFPQTDGGAGDVHPTVRRFLKMVGRPDLRAEFPEQYEKHWENKGLSGKVQILQFRIVDHPCELTFSLFFSGEEVIQTGIVIKYGDESLLNEVQKGDWLNYGATRRIDPVTFLKEQYPAAGALPTGSRSYALAVDDDSEEEVLRAVRQLTGKGEAELRDIWQHLLTTNHARPGTDRVSPIMRTWLKKERDRIDLQYLRFAQVLLPRSQDIEHFVREAHTCVVVRRKMAGVRIHEMVDAVEPEWWGGAFYGHNQGQLVRVAHEPLDRIKALQAFDGSFDFPVEEIFIDHRHIYSALLVGDEALVWRTRHQVAPNFAAAMPAVAEGVPAVGAGGVQAASPAPISSPGEPATHQYFVVRAEKAYMAALRGKAADLREKRREYLKLLFESDPRHFGSEPEVLLGDMQGAIEQALGRDARAIGREARLVEAYILVFLDERG